jgi:hypothetical protein
VNRLFVNEQPLDKTRVGYRAAWRARIKFNFFYRFCARGVDLVFCIIFSCLDMVFGVGLVSTATETPRNGARGVIFS